MTVDAGPLWMRARAAVRAARWGAPIALVAFAMIVLGWFLRLHAFGFPPTMTFDEFHFVENARNYLAGRADWNDHPPLGKLLIAAAMRLLGDRSVAWRAPALLFGAVTVVLGGFAAARLFRSGRAGWIAAALLSADGFLIGYSRVGLLDGYLGACAIGVVWLAASRWRWRDAVGAGLLAGIASTIKFSGVTVLFPLMLSLALAAAPRRRKLLLATLIIVLWLAVYFAVFALGLRLSNRPASVMAVLRETARLLEHHAGLTDMKNPWVSSWPTWVLPWRTMLLGYVEQGTRVRVLSCLGNMLTWWSSIALAVVLAGKTLWRGLGAVAHARPPGPASAEAPTLDGFLRANGAAVLVVLSTAAGFLAPWVLTHRDSYVYHFLPCYTPLVVLLAGFLAWLTPRRGLAVLIFIVAVFAVACFYAPVWSYFAMSPRYLKLRLFLPNWR